MLGVQRWAALGLVGLGLLMSPLALAVTGQDRQYGWELYARPNTVGQNQPDQNPETGLDNLEGLPWAKVYVPKGYNPEKPAPLALLLHGSGDNGRKMIDLFKSLAEERGVILVAPHSTDYSWDIMVRGAHLRDTTSIPPWGPDVGRIDKALDRAFDQFAIAADKVALIGFSDGAGYGLSLGTNNADLFNAVVAFAPGLLTRIDGKERTRVFLAHGEQDQVLPPGVTRNIFAPALVGEGFDVTLRMFQGRHVVPKNLRREAFDWWLNAESLKSRDPAPTTY